MAHAPSGFTLIELLVVGAIIALLAAILLPALQTAREQAVLAACQSGIRQSGVACLSYTSDFRGAYPYGWAQLSGESGPGYHYYAANAWSTPGGAAAILTNGQYIVNYQAMVCPAKVPPVPETTGLVYYNYWRVTMGNGWSTQADGYARATYGYVGFFGANGEALTNAWWYQPFTGESWYSGDNSTGGGVPYNVGNLASAEDRQFFVPKWTGRSGNWGMMLQMPGGNVPVLSCAFWQPYYTWSMGAWPHCARWTILPANTQWDTRPAGDLGRRNYLFRDGSCRTRVKGSILY